VQDEGNRELIESRVIAALKILSETAPRHLHWLQRQFIVIFIARLGGGRWIQLVPGAGILRFNPLLLWRLTDEEVALELAAAATRGRLRQAGFRDTGHSQVRILHRGALLQGAPRRGW
jgi:hypothetical protein